MTLYMALTNQPVHARQQSVLLGGRFKSLLQPLLLERLIEVREDDRLDDTHGRHSPVDEALRRLDSKLLLDVVLAGVVRHEGEGEHGDAVQEELQEHSSAAWKASLYCLLPCALG